MIDYIINIRTRNIILMEIFKRITENSLNLLIIIFSF